MLRQAVASLRFAHFSLFCLGLMWVWPFVYYVHDRPLTTFYQEWGAMLLGLCAMPLLLLKRQWVHPALPRIVLLPIGLMLLVMVQYAVGKMDYFSQLLLFALYFLWAALLVMLGRCLREELGMPLLATALAAFLLLGAELNTVAGLIQNFHWHSPLDRFVVVSWSVVFGNMAQANHFADYISLGLASLGLLYMRWNMRPWLVALLALPMLYVLVLCGSRSPLLFLSGFSALAYFWQRHDKSLRPLLNYSLLLLLGYFLVQFVMYIPWLSGGQETQTIFGRMSTTHSGVIRRWIWYEALLIFKAYPLLGAGFGQFAWQHFLLGPELHNPLIYGIYNSAHNLVMQVAAEMGLAGLLVLLGTLGGWVWQARRVPRNIYHWWGFSVLAVLGIHSLLEYPLWYSYFLGVAALLLGMLDGTTYRLESGRAGRMSLGVILLLGALSLAQVWQGYHLLERLSHTRMEKKEFFSQLLVAHRQLLFQPYVEVAINEFADVQVERLPAARALNESVMHYWPSDVAVYRQVYLLALSGEREEAQLQLERAIWAFPGGYSPFVEQMKGFVQKDPVHFTPLLEFAQRKHEEYQRATHAE